MQRVLGRMLVTLLGLVLGLYAAGVCRAGADAPPLPVEEYWQLVERTHAAALRWQDMPPEAARLEASQLAGEWAAVRAVALENGELAAVDTRPVVELLNAASPDYAGLAGQAGALLAVRDRWPGKTYTADQFTALQNILRRPEFQWRDEKEKSPLETWLAKLRRALDELLARLDIPGRLRAVPLLRYTLYAVAALAVTLALVFIVFSLRNSLVSEAVVDGDDPASDEGLSAEAALKRAQELSGGGDYRQAVRYLYLSALLNLEERGLLRYDRTRTNREYLRSVASQARLAALLQQVIEVFDRVWYGYQPLDADEYQLYAEQVEELRQQK